MSASKPGASFATLPSVSQIQERLARLFPQAMADRSLLVGKTCARAVYVFLYGGFVGAQGGLLRPAHIYFFTEEQSRLTGDSQRAAWQQDSARQAYRPRGKRWYADTTRESLRDDLFRNQLRLLGIVHRQGDVPTTSSRPAYYLADDFARLFDPALVEPGLESAMQAWRDEHLDAAVKSRMKLRHAFVAATTSDVPIDMPDGTRIKVAAGPSAPILKGIIEQFAPRYLRQPAVLWLSASDRKIWPQFEASAAAVGLRFSASAELPDLILADLAAEVPPRFVICEIVATGGAVTEARKRALLAWIEDSTIPVRRVEFLSAFADRAAPPLRKSFGQLAGDSLAWFHSEPDLLVTLRCLSTPAS